MKKSLLLTLLFVFFSSAQAAESQRISFADLQGQVAPYHDPFEDLTGEQLYHLSLYARIIEMQEATPARVTEAMIQAGEDAKQQLEQQDIDIKNLFAQRDIIMQKRQQAAMAINPLFVDKVIEMDGFMLPLEFNNGKVTEFLLVPTVGACSHEPVPPANQILLVKTTKAVTAGEVYRPVTVTGTLRVSSLSKDLYLIDGQKEIEMSYSLENTTLASY